MEGTTHYNAALLHQLDELLAQLNDQELSATRELLFGGTLGQHVRHILEYYTLLLQHHPSGKINYDLRERDRRIETEVDHARWTAQDSSSRLIAITEDRALTLECELPDHGRTAPQRTSLLRELTYVADHCVHHLAMVRIVVQQELPQVVFPDSFGVAAATRNHRSR